MAFAARLDTCVLIPSLQRDVVLELACQGAFRPLWSDQIEDELARTLRELREKRGVETSRTGFYIDRLVQQMNSALPDARIVTGDENLSLSLPSLPDQNDVHVVCAAVIGCADVIVTNNIKDFRQAELPADLFAQHPDEFLLDLLTLNPQWVFSALLAVSDRTGVKGPKRDAPQILNSLSTTFLNSAKQLQLLSLRLARNTLAMAALSPDFVGFHGIVALAHGFDRRVAPFRLVRATIP